jgi:hypothetical protein
MIEKLSTPDHSSFLIFSPVFRINPHIVRVVIFYAHPYVYVPRLKKNVGLPFKPVLILKLFVKNQ